MVDLEADSQILLLKDLKRTVIDKQFSRKMEWLATYNYCDLLAIYMISVEGRRSELILSAYVVPVSENLLN